MLPAPRGLQLAPGRQPGTGRAAGASCFLPLPCGCSVPRGLLPAGRSSSMALAAVTCARARTGAPKVCGGGICFASALHSWILLSRAGAGLAAQALDLLCSMCDCSRLHGWALSPPCREESRMLHPAAASLRLELCSSILPGAQGREVPLGQQAGGEGRAGQGPETEAAHASRHHCGCLVLATCGTPPPRCRVQEGPFHRGIRDCMAFVADASRKSQVPHSLLRPMGSLLCVPSCHVLAPWLPFLLLPCAFG